MTQDTIHQAKAAAGQTAADWVESGMRVGLGTGSTVFFFIQHLITRVREGLDICCVATSQVSEDLARQGGIKVSSLDELGKLDLTVDGADEIDPQKRMIKGGGGALLREKIVASRSQEMVVIVDEGKCVSQLGSFPLPVEIIPFAHQSTKNLIEELGYPGEFRKQADQNLFVTDNGNFILDLQLKGLTWDPQKLDLQLLQIPGVVETGLFLNLAGRVVVGTASGNVKILQ